ncbi:hypothetical protein ABLO27_14175 [Roseibium sp. SCPC15]|uniref:hypothetical protein n=1 Tax=Roseibium sp. SCP15 TaxID=3141376 RepID=UPI00333BD51D
MGGGIVVGGFTLAEGQRTALEEHAASRAVVHQQLISALSEARLTVPRLRLEELATLPLIPEYLAIASKHPDSEDTVELENYLRTILNAASEETGLERITLETVDGTELLASGQSPASAPITETPRLEADVLDFEDLKSVSGKLAGYLPESAMSVLLPQAGEGVEVTSSISASGAGSASSISTIPDRTRLLAILGGLASAMLGLLGAVLMKRQRGPLS